MKYAQLIPPFWIRQVRKYLPPRPIILDFGCGNDSPRLTKTWFSSCTYHGADISAESDSAWVDVFHKVRESDDLAQIPDQSFDLVLMKHVIEHLSTPLETLGALIGKLKPGGVIFVSFPDPQSVSFPSAEGTLNFYDDPTHIWLPSLEGIIGTMVARNVVILRRGTTRAIDKVLLGIPFYLLNTFRAAAGTRRRAKGLWDLYGFEYHVIGRVGSD
jgi:SAM-dependent methyltransferase